MSVCVIFNPAARGERAQKLRHFLDGLHGECTLKPTDAPGAGRRLAAQAVMEGFDTIVAAGGDGTLNEVLNGLVDAPDGTARARLAVLPMGTVNVFALELGIPFDLPAAWQIIRAGRERLLDLPWSEYQGAHGVEKRCFIQLAGAGIDARSIELVDWSLKKRIGFFAYVVALCRAMARHNPPITVRMNECQRQAELVVLGNGRYFGGRYAVFENANMSDGRLDACLFPKVNLWVGIRVASAVLATGHLPRNYGEHHQGETVSLTSHEPVPFQLDGELVGHLPVTMGLHPRALRVIVP